MSKTFYAAAVLFLSVPILCFIAFCVAVAIVAVGLWGIAEHFYERMGGEAGHDNADYRY